LFSAARSPSSVYTQSPDDIPPIDPKALFDVEMHARKVAENLDTLMQGLVGKLHKVHTTSMLLSCCNVIQYNVMSFEPDPVFLHIEK